MRNRDGSCPECGSADFLHKPECTVPEQAKAKVRERIRSRPSTTKRQPRPREPKAFPFNIDDYSHGWHFGE